MTCDQAKEIFYDQKPWDRTKAEMASFIAHVRHCQGQCVAVRERLREYVERNAVQYHVSESYKRGSAAYRELIADPEAVEVMFGPAAQGGAQ